MNKKYLILIPTLFMAVSCGNPASAQTGDFENKDYSHVFTSDEINAIYNNISKNIMYTTSFTSDVVTNYTDAGNEFALGPFDGCKKIIQKENASYYSGVEALKSESMVLMYDAYDKIGLSMEDYYYSEFEKSDDDTIATAIVKQYSKLINNGSVMHVNAECDKIPTSTLYKDALRDFQTYAHRFVSISSINILEVFNGVDYFVGYVDDNELIFKFKVSYSEFITNYKYHSDPSKYPQYLLTSYNIDAYLTLENTDKGYRAADLYEKVEQKLYQDSDGNFLVDPILLLYGEADICIGYGENTDYEKQNCLDFVGPSGDGFAPLVTVFTGLPTTSIDTDAYFYSYDTTFNAYNYRYELLGKTKVSPDELYFTGTYDLYDGDIVSFTTYCNSDVGVTTGKFEVVDLTGGKFEVKEVEDVGTFLVFNKGDISVRINVETKSTYNFLTDVKTSDIVKVTVMPDF